MSKLPHPCKGMSRRAHEVFEQIAVGNDGGHHPRILKSLQSAGLIVGHIEQKASGIPGVSMSLVRYTVPVPIHADWCAWCAETVGAADD